MKNKTRGHDSSWSDEQQRRKLDTRHICLLELFLKWRVIDSLVTFRLKGWGNLCCHGYSSDYMVEVCRLSKQLTGTGSDQWSLHAETLCLYMDNIWFPPLLCRNYELTRRVSTTLMDSNRFTPTIYKMILNWWSKNVEKWIKLCFWTSGWTIAAPLGPSWAALRPGGQMAAHSGASNCGLRSPTKPPCLWHQWAALWRPVWTTEPLFPAHPASVPPPLHHMLINRPHWQIWIPLGSDWRFPLASINLASGVLSPALKGGIKWCELLWVNTWLLSRSPEPANCC